MSKEPKTTTTRSPAGAMSGSSAVPIVAAPYSASVDDSPSPSAPFPDDDTQPLIIGYPVISETVPGTPVFAFYPPPPPPPLPRRQRFRCSCSGCIPRFCGSFACLSAFLLLLLAAAAFFVWPRDIDVTSVDVSLGKVHFNIDNSSSIPKVYISITLCLQLQAENPNYFGFAYDTIAMSIYFEGDEIGEAVSDGGFLEALQTSSIDATLELDATQISSNIVTLIADIVERAVPLQTVTVFDGYTDVFGFSIPVEGKITCDIVVDPVKQEILSQTCS